MNHIPDTLDDLEALARTLAAVHGWPVLTAAEKTLALLGVPSTESTTLWRALDMRLDRHYYEKMTANGKVWDVAALERQATQQLAELSRLRE